MSRISGRQGDSSPFEASYCCIYFCPLRQNLNNREIVAVSSRGRGVQGHLGAGERRGGVLHLHPIRIADGGEVLVKGRLAGTRRACDRVVVVVPYPEDPRVVARR